MAKAAPALDLLGAVFDALAVGAPGGLLSAFGGVVAAALVRPEAVTFSIGSVRPLAGLSTPCRTVMVARPVQRLWMAFL